MILKSLTLKNFRQFINDEIVFSTDPEKNVTLIRGNNTSGKTTIASAFRWCLFGDTNLEGSILNKVVAHDMYEGAAESVEVTIKLEKDNTEYTITRRQEFVKNGTGISEKRHDIQIESTNREEGISREPYADPDDKQDMIKHIIPEYLSVYLFVTGEQINNIEEWIKTKKSDKALHSSVRTILGLEPPLNAVNHLDAAQKKFKDQLKPSDEEQAETLRKKIEELKKTIDSDNATIREDEQSIENLQAENRKLSEQMKTAVSDEEIVKYIDSLKADVADIQNEKKSERKKFLDSFSKMLANYCITILAPGVIEMLGNRKKSDIYPPIGVSEETVKALLDRKVCLCGNSLEEGSEGCSRLRELLEELPPMSIESEIYYFKNRLQNQLNDQKIYDLKSSFDVFREDIDKKEKNLLQKQKEIERKEAILKTSEHSSDYMRQIEENNTSIGKLLKTIAKLTSECDEAVKEHDEMEAAFRNLTRDGKDNAQINLCIDYANYLSKFITEELNTREKEYLDKINNKVNEIFLSVFNKNYNIKIDDKYRISVTDEYTNETIGLSGSESIFVVLSFISAILYIASTNKSDIIKTEPYPLVLDAPLSNFDPQNMTQASKKFPELSKQVIIISKEPEMKCIAGQVNDSVGKFYDISIEEKDGKDTLKANISEKQGFNYG